MFNKDWELNLDALEVKLSSPPPRLPSLFNTASTCGSRMSKGGGAIPARQETCSRIEDAAAHVHQGLKDLTYYA